VIVVTAGVESTTPLFSSMIISRGCPSSLSSKSNYVIERAGKGVERAAGLDALAIKPVVFDEAQHPGLIGERVVDEVALGEWRDQQERHARLLPAGRKRRSASAL
jgi:hypothetical protein